MSTYQKLNTAWDTTKWLFTQLFSSAPDPSVTSGVRMLNWMSKGFLIIGAISSISYTAPTSFNVWSGILPYTLSVALTIICVVLILFLIELSFGALTPFALSQTLSGDLFKSTNSSIGGVALWVLLIFMGFLSMYFTYNGADVPVHAAIVAPVTFDISTLETQKQDAIKKEEDRYDAIIAKYHKEDSLNFEALKKYHHEHILSVERYAIKVYGQHSHHVHEAVSKAQKDSTIKTEDFHINKAKAPWYVRERTEAINDTRDTWNKIIEEKKKDNGKLEKTHNSKVSAATMLIQNFGAGSTLLFFIIQIITTMLKLGDAETVTQKKKFHNP